MEKIKNCYANETDDKLFLTFDVDIYWLELCYFIFKLLKTDYINRILTVKAVNI